MKVVHVVRSDAFAGVEKYISVVAPAQATRGFEVTVIGGDPARMPELLPGCTWLPARTTLDTVKALAAQRADLVHAHMTAAELAAVATRRRHRGRIVVTRHFAEPRGASLLGAHWIPRHVDREISISRYVAEAIGVPSTVLLNPVAPGPLSVKRDRTVLCLQRFEAEKDTRTALKAWQLSGLSQQGWTLQLAGRGALEADLRAQAAGIPGIEFLGFVTDPSTLLSRAGCLLATAPAEPFGLSVAEAMSCGTPVVAADGGAHRELLGPEGSYFPPGDAAAAAQALQHLGPGLRERARELFDLDRHLDGLEAVYA